MGTLWLWVGFNVFVLLLLALDLGVFHRRAHAITLREASIWSVVWVAISLLFNLGLWHWYGSVRALEFFTGYLIEKSLSVDNLFVFTVLFRYFGVEPRHQHRVLFWGIVGALLMRGAMIGAGVALIKRFEWVLYLFGAFLVYAGWRMLVHKAEEIHPEHNPIFRLARKYLPITKGYEGQKFFLRKEGIWYATPLVLVLIVVETTDLAFALDSIPAIFAITRDAFIVYTSNVCAILGLRAFYFLLAGVLPYFRYLSTGLAMVLMFVGAKMLGERWVQIPTHVSLEVVAGVLAVAVLASVIAARAEAHAAEKLKAQEAQARHGRSTPKGDVAPLAPLIAQLSDGHAATRAQAARSLYELGRALGEGVVQAWQADPTLARLLSRPPTVGIAVWPESFGRIHARAGSPRLAEVPADQQAREFSLDSGGTRLDILTTPSAAGTPSHSGHRPGAIARFLQKFGEGIQQVEYPVTDVDRATQLLRERFGQQPIYPQARAGADGTRVNFFLASTPEGKKVLIELVEEPGKAKT